MRVIHSHRAVCSSGKSDHRETDRAVFQRDVLLRRRDNRHCPCPSCRKLPLLAPSALALRHACSECGATLSHEFACAEGRGGTSRRKSYQGHQLATQIYSVTCRTTPAWHSRHRRLSAPTPAPPTTYKLPLTNLAQYLLLDSWPSNPDPNFSLDPNPDPNANLATLLPLVGALPATRPILPARRRAAAARNTPLLRHAAAQALPQPDSNPNPGRKPGTYFLPSPSPSSNLNPNDDPT